MLEKGTSNQISVVRKMMGLEDEIAGGRDADLVVPQNSLSNVRQKMRITERPRNRTVLGKMNTLRDSNPALEKCPHCENMAKNFLYLESLLRANYDPRQNCQLCHTAMKYLQYVNKSILHVFGQFDSIMEAARNFAIKPRRPKRALKPSLNAGLKSTLPKKRKKKDGKADHPQRQEGGSNMSPEASVDNAPPGTPETTGAVKKLRKKSTGTKKATTSSMSTDAAKKRTKTAAVIRRALQEKDIKIKRKKKSVKSKTPLPQLS